MVGEDAGAHRARLLLFERDPLKRHYFRKYVRGMLWRHLTTDEQQERIRRVVDERRATPRRELGTAGDR